MTELGALLLPVAPLLGLLAFLLLGRYPGCETLIRLSERIAQRGGPRRTRAARPARPRPRGFPAPAGGLLIAFGLAQRPPPLPA